MAKGAGGEVGEEGIVLGVGGRHDDGAGARRTEDHLFQSGQAIFVQMLDHLDQNRGVDASPTVGRDR